jgi:hypothetical protein
LALTVGKRACWAPCLKLNAGFFRVPALALAAHCD